MGWPSLQELDDQFLIMWGGFRSKGERTLKYVNREGLRAFLLERIPEGFMFPLNPKWLLCDEGWFDVYAALNRKADLSVWLPPESGLPQMLESIVRLPWIHTSPPLGARRILELLYCCAPLSGTGLSASRSIAVAARALPNGPLFIVHGHSAAHHG